MNRRKLFLLLTLLINISTFAQVYSERTYDLVGLQNGDKVYDALKTGISIIIIGFIVMYLSTLGNKDSQSTIGNSFGCFGIIIMLVGAFFLLPLIAWIEFAFVSILSIGIAIVVICLLFFWIYNSIAKK